MLAGFRAEDYFIIRNIYFEYNAYELDAEAKKGSWTPLYADEYPTSYIEVIGHTDARGKRWFTITNYLFNAHGWLSIILQKKELKNHVL